MGVVYRNYVRMFPLDRKPGTFKGDMHLLPGERVVGMCDGIRFKRVSRAMMHIVFPRQTGKGNSGGRDPGIASADVRYSSSSSSSSITGSSKRHDESNSECRGLLTAVTYRQHGQSTTVR